MILKDLIKLATLTGGYYADSRVTSSENLSIKNNSIEISVAELQQFLVPPGLPKPKTADRKSGEILKSEK